MCEVFPQGPLRATTSASLPCHHAAAQGAIAPSGPLQIGGYAWEEAIGTDPVADAASHAVKAAEAGRWDGPVSGDVSDWVPQADWQAGMDVEGWESASVHWVIQREDLAARRFDRTITDVFWNP
ncbi:hypothetical protein ACWKT3_23520 [Streptomyces violaceus]